MAKQILCILLFFVSTHLHAQYKNLVFEGGGVRGIAFAGATEVLEQKNILQGIEKIGGTSAGSIIGMMLCLGYSASEIHTIMLNLKIQEFNDGRGGVFGKYKRARNEFGIHKGDTFAKWIENLVEQKTGNPGLTFFQLDSLRKTNKVFKSFYCVGTNLSKQRAEVFSTGTTPNLPIKTAVRISSSIPFFYEPVLLDSSGIEPTKIIKGYNYQLYVDGGISENFPINLFDSCKAGGQALFCDSDIVYNPLTLGFKLEREAQIKQFKNSDTLAGFTIKNFKEYTQAFINFAMQSLNNKPNLENEKDRTVYISYGNISAVPRKMSVKQKQQLFENGQNATTEFLDHIKIGNQ